jgi:enoyl-CoA hydratase/carnithine racemase
MNSDALKHRSLGRRSKFWSWADLLYKFHCRGKAITTPFRVARGYIRRTDTQPARVEITALDDRVGARLRDSLPISRQNRGLETSRKEAAETELFGRNIVIDLKREGDVYVLTLEDGENRFNRASIAAWNAALDEVENDPRPAALVTTGTGKFYSNGLDLDWLTSEGKAESQSFIASVHGLFGRMLSFPATTIAAINGHAFAGGGMLALAHDYRIMREDRGYFCLPEIDLGMPLTEGMTALIQSKIPAFHAHEAIVTGRRYGGAEAKLAQIVHDAVPETVVLETALAIATPLAGKDSATLAALKRGMYPETLRILGV